MAKKQQNFEFLFPLTHKVVEDGRVVTKHVGDFLVIGVAYFNENVSVIDFDRYTVDLDFIKWGGTDIKDVLEITADNTLSEIYDAAVQHASGLFDFNDRVENSMYSAAEDKADHESDELDRWENRTPNQPSSLFQQAADIARAHAKIFYGIDLKGGDK